MAIHLRAKKKPTKHTVFTSKPSAESIPLTAQGYAELQAELETLKSQRPHISEEIYRAAADKDFRENAPLEAAREAQGQLEGRIRGLESILGIATVSEKEIADIHQLALGNTVVLQDLITNEELCYKLVSPSEVNLAKGKISTASPTGKALLGQKEGEIIEVVAPAGVWRYRIARIER